MNTFSGDLSKHKDGLERERDRLINEVTQLNTKLANALSYQEELERKTSATDLKVNEYAGLLEVIALLHMMALFRISVFFNIKQTQS